jgi:hypothetical protein
MQTMIIWHAPNDIAVIKVTAAMQDTHSGLALSCIECRTAGSIGMQT